MANSAQIQQKLAALYTKRADIENHDERGQPLAPPPTPRTSVVC